MSRALFAGLLALSGMVLAQSQPAPDSILRPGQVWSVEATLPDGTSQRFTVTLGAAPSLNRDGMVAYSNFDMDVAGNLVLTRLWHDPVDADPEFLQATRADADGHEQHCFTWNPSQQKDLTRFTGVYATSAQQLARYVQSGSAAGLGRCTMTLER